VLRDHLRCDLEQRRIGRGVVGGTTILTVIVACRLAQGNLADELGCDLNSER